MAQWEVRLFAYLRERHGATVTVEAEPTANAILTALADAGIAIDACRLAVGDEFATGNAPIPPGTEIALIPPVSGG